MGAKQWTSIYLKLLFPIDLDGCLEFFLKSVNVSDYFSTLLSLNQMTKMHHWQVCNSPTLGYLDECHTPANIGRTVTSCSGRTPRKWCRQPDGNVGCTSNNGPERPFLTNQEVLIIYCNEETKYMYSLTFYWQFIWLWNGCEQPFFKCSAQLYVYLHVQYSCLIVINLCCM